MKIADKFRRLRCRISTDWRLPARKGLRRLENSGACGVAEVVDGKCAACGAKISEDEIDYLRKNKNIGVCDNCFAFIYMPDEKFNDDGFFDKLLGK